MMPTRPPAGRTQSTPASGRKHGDPVRASGPMRLVAFLSRSLAGLVAGLVLATPLTAAAQQKAPAPAQPGAAKPGAAKPLPPKAVPEWRRTDTYRFPAMADTVRRMQHGAQAMQLREYCADRRVPDDFVRERLQRFGRITGREESCASLNDYSQGPGW